MARFFGLLILIALALAPFTMAQDSAAPPADDTTAAQSDDVGAAGTDDDAAADDADAAADDAEPDLLEDPDLDEQTYEEDEDVFVPTEEIPSDEPIPFPTNI
ncbi:MAG: hypothetical protein WBM54_08920 [Woeseia sp.]